MVKELLLEGFLMPLEVPAAWKACAAASGFWAISQRPPVGYRPLALRDATAQPAQIAEKHERRCVHDPYAHGASSAAALSSASICSSCKLMA